MYKKLFQHSILYSIPAIITQAASLLILPWVTPYLTAFDYGVYGVIMSYLFFITTLKDLGFGVLFVNSFFRYPKRWKIIWRMLSGHLIYWSLVYFSILTAVLYFFLPEEVSHNFFHILLLVALPTTVFDSVNMIGNYYYRFSERPAVIAGIGVLSGICSIVVTYYSIVELGLGYMSWFIGTFVVSLISFLFYVYPVYFKLGLTPVLKFRKRFIKKNLKISLPMIPHNYSSYLLNSADRVVMDLVGVNMNKIGLYNIAYRFGSAFEMMGEAVGMAVSPYYVKFYMANNASGLHAARKLTYLLMVAFLAIAFIVSLWMHEIFLLLINNDTLVGAYDVAIIIFMSYCYRPMYWCTVNKLSTFEKTSVLWRISFVAGLLNLVLNMVLVPLYGIYAAAIVTFISLMFVGFAGFYLRDYRQLKSLNHYPLLWLLSIIILASAAFALRDATILVKLLITITSLCGIALGMKRYLHNDDWLTLRPQSAPGL